MTKNPSRFAALLDAMRIIRVLRHRLSVSLSEEKRPITALGTLFRAERYLEQQLFDELYGPTHSLPHNPEDPPWRPTENQTPRACPTPAGITLFPLAPKP